MFDFVCVGDVARDLLLFLKEPPIFDGEKHSVNDIAWSLGGNAANVSVGLSRLGIKTDLVTVFGDDDRGAWIKRELLNNGVDLASSQTETDRASNLSTVMVVNGERTIFSYHSTGEKDITAIPQTKWVYLTNPPGRDSKAITNLVLSEHNFKLACNPGKDFNPELLAITDILILNKEEQEKLGTFGPKITVITDGKNGAKVFENGKLVFEKPSVATEVVEVTGAGDAFSSGFLAAIFYDKNLEEALDWGLKNSASVVSKVGAIEGLLCLKNI